MSFIIRQPFTLSTALRSLPRASQPTLRAFHTTPNTRLINTKFTLKSRNAFTKPTPSTSRLISSSTKRTYNAPPNPTIPTQPTQSLTSRLLYGGAIVAGGAIAANLVFNRETREDGGMPQYERAYLNETFMHTGLGIGMIGLAARALHTSGWSVRLMSMNPWLVVGGGLALSIGSMIATRSIDPDNYIPKYLAWSAFNVSQAAILSPLMFLQPALLARAGLYTVAMMGSIAFVGATAKQEKYLYIGGPLLAGCAIVAVSGFAPLVLPATAVRTLAVTENLWLWGGLAVFGGFTLYDTQKILHHARLAERGLVKRDAVNESISLELDFLNIFIRMVQILGMSRNNRR